MHLGVDNSVRVSARDVLNDKTFSLNIRDKFRLATF